MTKKIKKKKFETLIKNVLYYYFSNDTKITETENIIPDTTALVRATDSDTKVTVIENKILNISEVTKKTDFDTKVNKIIQNM